MYRLHQRLQVMPVRGVYRQRLVPWSHCHLYLTVASLWRQFPATGRRYRAAVSVTSGGNDQRVPKLWSVLQNCLLHTFHQFWHHQGLSATTAFVVHNGSAFSELPAPSSDRTEITQLAGDNISAAIFSYCCAIGPNYCRHKTETALHYSHNLPFLVLRMSIRVQHSYNLWTRLEFGPRKKWIFKIYKKKIQP